MKGFFDKIGLALGRMMQGRNGMDNLATATLWTGLICTLLDGFLGTGLLYLIGMALYIWTLFRIMSRNTAKRGDENSRFVNWWENIKTAVRQWWLRMKNMKTYKYFRCPQCKVRLRLKRGCGEKTVTCPKCKHSFTQKA